MVIEVLISVPHILPEPNSDVIFYFPISVLLFISLVWRSVYTTDIMVVAVYGGSRRHPVRHKHKEVTIGTRGGNDFILRVVPAESIVDRELGRLALVSEMGENGEKGTFVSAWRSRKF